MIVETPVVGSRFVSTIPGPSVAPPATQVIETPAVIPLSKVRAFVADLGFDAVDLIELTCGLGGVYVEVYAKDEQGHRYVNPGTNHAATHSIALRLDQGA